MIRLRGRIAIFAPRERCFDLARSVEAHAHSSRLIDGRAVAGRTTGLSELGDCTMWSARFFGVRFQLSTRIAAFDRPHYFSDMLCGGLFSDFAHGYFFELDGAGRTIMRDDFEFQSHGGPLSSAFDTLALKRRMQAVASARLLFLKRVAESQQWRRYGLRV
jgi:ligand-binding SRPBCC domain-containing protein